MRPVLSAAPEGPVGVAVSGGSDSTALLLLLERWARGTGRSLAAVTVDHGLRPESAGEAAAVGRLCAARGIGHDVLRWEGRPGGNLQDRARRARRALIGDWAAARGIGAVALGHTLDDQAETVLMRLARGSGVDGLAAMAAVTEGAGLVWLRPLLGLRRAALRAWLSAGAVRWVEDPTNADPAYNRVRARAMLGALAPLGLTAERLAQTAARMGRARAALEADTSRLAVAALTEGGAGDLWLDPAPLAAAPREVGLRLLAAALMWVSGAGYRPRLVPLEAALDAIAGGGQDGGLGAGLAGGLTLHGCVLRPRRGRVAIRREPQRVAGPVPLAAARWDGRWRLVAGPAAPDGWTIGALGPSGLAAVPGWRDRGIAREALVTTPAVRDAQGDLVAAPLIEAGPWRFVRIAAVSPPWDAPLARE